MRAAARGSGSDQVYSRTGTGRECASPLRTSTGQCSSTVFVNGIGAVRIGDRVAPHALGGCGPDNSGLTTSSSTVFVEGRGMGRIGDEYTSDNTITTGSQNVFLL